MTTATAQAYEVCPNCSQPMRHEELVQTNWAGDAIAHVSCPIADSFPVNVITRNEDLETAMDQLDPFVAGEEIENNTATYAGYEDEMELARRLR